MTKPRGNGIVEETSHRNVDKKKYDEGWDRIFGKKKKKKESKEKKKEKDNGK